MEYKILQKIYQLGLPKVVRIFLGILFILLAIAGMILPVLPGFTFLLIALALLIPGKKIIKIIKIRKGLVHLYENFSVKKLKYKLIDFKTHLKEMIFTKLKKTKTNRRAIRSLSEGWRNGRDSNPRPPQ